MRVYRPRPGLFTLGILLCASLASAQPAEWVTFSPPALPVPPQARISDLLAAPGPDVWARYDLPDQYYDGLGTGRHSLLRYEGSRWREEAGLSLAPYPWLSRLARDPAGRLWVGAGTDSYGGALFRRDEAGWATTPGTEWYTGAGVDVVADSAGAVWVRMVDSKYPASPSWLFRYAGGGEGAYLGLRSEGGVYARGGMGAGPDSSLWVVIASEREDYSDSSSTTLLRHKAGAWTAYDDVPVASAAGPLVVDGTGTVWLGSRRVPGYAVRDTVAEGLIRFDGAASTVFTAANTPLPSDTVTALAVEGGGVLWIGTPAGLARLDGTTWTVYAPAPSGLPARHVTALAVDARGNKWIGTFDPATGPHVTVFREGGVVGVGTEPRAVPLPGALQPPYPNPFTSQTRLGYTLRAPSHVRLALYDVLGRRVRVLDDGVRGAGRHEVLLQATGLPGGAYVVRLEAEGLSATRPLLLLR